MRIRIWGCRGSLASPGPDTVRYGGNTSCVEVRVDDDQLIVLDAGTGIRPLGLSLEDDPPKVVHLFLTHLHLDHLEGLGFFGPLWDDKVELHVWGPPSPTRILKDRIARYLSPPLFPVRLTDIPAGPIFHDVPMTEWELGGARIVAAPVKHTDPTVGYRIHHNGRTLAYMPDHEPARGDVDLLKAEERWISGFQIAAGADLLLHDSQYTEDEYKQRVGWVHSSIKHTVAFSMLTGVQQLLMFHHDPMHTDQELEELLGTARTMWNGRGQLPELAYEGLEIELS